MLPVFTAVLYLCSICPIRPDCFLLTTSPSSQTLYCESRFICSAYRFLLLASISIVLATTVAGVAWVITNDIELVDAEDLMDVDEERGWREDFDEDATDCEDEEVERSRRYKD